MEPYKIRGTTQRLVSRTGAGRQGNIFSFQSREKNVLDMPSYRSGDSTTLRFLFAKIDVDECYGDFSQILTPQVGQLLCAD